MIEDPLCLRAAGVLAVARDELVQNFNVLGICHRRKVHFSPIATDGCKVSGTVQIVGDSASHAGGKVSSGASEYDHQPVRHVLAAVVAHALNHGGSARVADCKALARHTTEVSFAAGSAIETDVADQNIFFRYKLRFARVADDQPAAREPFTHVVVGVALEGQRDSFGQKSAEALPGATGEVHANGVFRQACRTVAPRNLSAQHGAHGAMNVADGHAEHNRRAVLNGLLRHLDQLAIERLVECVVLRLQAATAHMAGHRRIVKNRRKIDSRSLPVGHGFALNQAINPANHFVDGAEAELCHDPAQVFGNEEKEIDHVFGRAVELLAQLRVLRGHAYRTSVQVALAHHDAAHGNERRGGEAELFGSEQRRNGYVASGLEFAVSLQPHTAAQVVEHKNLLRL